MSLPPPALFALSTGLSVAQGVGEVMAQRSAAEAQQAQNDIAAANARTKRDADYDQLMLMARQERAAASQQIEENRNEALQASERALVSAGESGVTGLSLGALLADINRNNARYTDGVNQNLENAGQQIAFEADNVAANYQNTLNRLPTVQQPNYLGTVLRTGASIYGGYRDHLKITP